MSNSITAAGQRPPLKHSQSGQLANPSASPTIKSAAGQRPPMRRLSSSQTSVLSSTASTRSLSTAGSAGGVDNRRPGSRRSSTDAAEIDANVPPRTRRASVADSFAAYYASVMDETPPLQRVLMPQPACSLPSHYTFVNNLFVDLLKRRSKPTALANPQREGYAGRETDYNLLNPTAPSVLMDYRNNDYAEYWHNFGQLRIDQSSEAAQIKLTFSHGKKDMEIASTLDKWGLAQGSFSGCSAVAVANVCGPAMQGDGILVVFDWRLDRRENNRPTCDAFTMVGFYSDIQGFRNILSHPSYLLPEIREPGKKYPKAPWMVPVACSERRLPFRKDEMVVFRLGGGWHARMMDAYDIRRVVAY